MANIELSKELLAEMCTIRHQLHQHPELSGKEFLTTKLIKEYLLQQSIKILPQKMATGVIAEIDSGKPGPTIALRADIDALPIREETQLAYASKIDGIMHACGHDFHTASLLGAAKILQAEKSELAGKVRLIFQPAEEINQGAKQMIASGALTGVDAIIGFHNKPDLTVGTIGIKSGPLMAAVDQFKVVIKGEGSHAAAPQNGNDPIVTASQIITSLQTIISRHISPTTPAVLSVTRIEGGNTWNVIPDSVELEGTIRTFDERSQLKIKELFEQTIDHFTQAFGQESIVEWVPSPPVLSNDADLGKLIAKASSEFAQVVRPEWTMGGEDFANYQQVIPGFFAFIGTGSPYEWHHPAFTIDDKALPYSIQYYVKSTKILLAELADS